MAPFDHQDGVSNQVKQGPVLVLDRPHAQVVLLQHLLGLEQTGLQGGHGPQVTPNGGKAIAVRALGQRIENRKFRLVFEDVVDVAPTGRPAGLIRLGQHLLHLDTTLAGDGVEPAVSDPLLAKAGEVCKPSADRANHAGRLQVEIKVCCGFEEIRWGFGTSGLAGFDGRFRHWPDRVVAGVGPVLLEGPQGRRLK